MPAEHDVLIRRTSFNEWFKADQTMKLRFLAGADAEKIVAGRAKITDEQWLEQSSAQLQTSPEASQKDTRVTC